MNENEVAAQRAVETILGSCGHFEMGQLQANGLRRLCEECVSTLTREFEGLLARQAGDRPLAAQDDALTVARIRMRECAADIEVLRPFQGSAGIFAAAWALAMENLSAATQLYVKELTSVAPVASAVVDSPPCEQPSVATGQPSPYSAR